MTGRTIGPCRPAELIGPGPYAPRVISDEARAWRNGKLDRVCDAIEAWEHGRVVRATRHPNYFDLNCVLVEEPAGMNASSLIAVADRYLARFRHRKLEMDLVEEAEGVRPDFDERGWKSSRLVWMRHDAPLPAGPKVPVEEVPYDSVHDLRDTWHREDYPDLDPGEYHAEAREVALQCGARVFASVEDGAPVGFSEVEYRDGSAEVASVYVLPEHRGGGRGTAITRAAIEACSDADDLWIVADDEDRPKELYRRLGFRPKWISMEFLLPPAPS